MSNIHGIEWGAKHTITGPDGTIAVFNDDTDANYVGILTPDSSGHDSAEVRESFEDFTESDGAVHGLFYAGRRPWVLNGTIIASSVTNRNTKVDKLRRACYALQGDSVINWTSTGGVAMQSTVRLQSRLAFTGGYVKQFQIPMIAADPRIYSVATTTTAVGIGVGNVTVTNNGDALTYPIIKLRGPMTDAVISRGTQGISVVYTLIATEELWIYPETGRVIKSINSTGQPISIDAYSSVTFGNTSWWGLAAGANSVNVTMTGSTGASAVNLFFRDAFI